MSVFSSIVIEDAQRGDIITDGIPFEERHIRATHLIGELRRTFIHRRDIYRDDRSGRKARTHLLIGQTRSSVITRSDIDQILRSGRRKRLFQPKDTRAGIDEEETTVDGESDPIVIGIGGVDGAELRSDRGCFTDGEGLRSRHEDRRVDIIVLKIELHDGCGARGGPIGKGLSGNQIEKITIERREIIQRISIGDQGVRSIRVALNSKARITGRHSNDPGRVVQCSSAGRRGDKTRTCVARLWLETERENYRPDRRRDREVRGSDHIDRLIEQRSGKADVVEEVRDIILTDLARRKKEKT